MKTCLLFLSLVLCALASMVVDSPRLASASGPVQIASDNFASYTNGQLLDTTGNWDVVANNYVIADLSGTKVAAGNAYNSHNAVFWAGAGTFNANQYSETTVYYSSQFGLVGVCVRGSAGNTCYRAVWYDGTMYLQKYNADVEATITTAAFTLADNHKIRLSVTGTGSATRLTVDVDTGSGFTSLIPSTDPGGTYINSGKPGLATESSSTQNANRSWRGGNL